MDSFDHYSNSQGNLKWTSFGLGGGTLTSSVHRTGTQSYNLGTTLTKTLDNQATWVVGQAFCITGLAAGTFLEFEDGTSVQDDVRLTAGGALQFTRNGTVLATSANGVIVAAGGGSCSSNPTWNYIETKVTINSSTGSFDVHVNGTSVISGTNQNTQSTGNAFANTIVFNTVSNLFIDDVYMCDGTGASSNTFLGVVSVTASLPNANSSVTWTPSTGSNFSNVNSSPPGSNYNSTSTLNNQDLFTLPALTGAAPLAHQVILYAEEDSAGTRAVATAIHSGSTTSVGSNYFLMTTYSFALTVGDQDPNTSAAWTLGNWNAATWGYKLTQ